MMSKPYFLLGAGLLCPLLCQCTSLKPKGDELIVSVSDQRLVLLDDGQPVKSYPVSTSKFGLGSKSRSYKTPLGKMYVHQKIGDGARSGAVFKSRRPTGEVLRPNTPGRDPIVSRILWLEGKERTNQNTRERMIYIHGTPEERTIGRPASYGCIRMKSRDVIDLYDRIPVGVDVHVKRSHLKAGEIPQTDRTLMAAAEARTGGSSPSPSSLRRSAPVVYAAAQPSRPQRTKPPTPPPSRAAVKRPPPPRMKSAPAPAPTSSEPPRRRGAFTKISSASTSRPAPKTAAGSSDSQRRSLARAGR